MHSLKLRLLGCIIVDEGVASWGKICLIRNSEFVGLQEVVERFG